MEIDKADRRMLNRALAKLVFIAFWGMVFQCQVVSAVASPHHTSESQSSEPKSGFCKKKLINDQQELSVVTIGQTNPKQPVQPFFPGYIGRVTAYLIASLQTLTSGAGLHQYPLAHCSAVIYRANPNKAPPLVYRA